MKRDGQICLSIDTNLYLRAVHHLQLKYSMLQNNLYNLTAKRTKLSERARGSSAV